MSFSTMALGATVCLARLNMCTSDGLLATSVQRRSPAWAPIQAGNQHQALNNQDENEPQTSNGLL